MNKSDKQCWLCDQDLTPTREHIFPQSIGGRKTVRWFICEKCNNETGTQWDAYLINSIFQLHRLARGDLSHAASVDVTLTDNDGNPVDAKMSGLDDIRISNIRKDGNQLSASVSDEEEARRILEQWKRKYPHIDVDEELRNAERSVYASREVTFSIVVEIPRVEKSIVKTAMAWAFHNGIKPEQCELAYDFLRNGYPDDHPPQSWFLIRSLDEIQGGSTAQEGLELLKVGHPDITSNLDVMLCAQLMRTGKRLVALVSYGAFTFVVPLSERYTGGKINTDPLIEIYSINANPQKA